MKSLIVTAALITALATPAGAEWIAHQDVDVSVPHSRVWVNRAPAEAFATVVAPGRGPLVVRSDIVRRNIVRRNIRRNAFDMY